MSRFLRFARERKGLAAVEFALLAPIMIFVLFASIELIDALDTNTRVQNATASIADVAARDTEISNSEIAGMWAALDVLLFPEDAADMSIRLSSISIIDENTALVVWSEGHGMTPRSSNEAIELPDGMMIPGTSVMMAESSYPYAATLGFLFESDITLNHVAYRRSRLIDPIPRVS